jgi:hypothetical protein
MLATTAASAYIIISTGVRIPRGFFGNGERRVRRKAWIANYETVCAVLQRCRVIQQYLRPPKDRGERYTIINHEQTWSRFGRKWNKNRLDLGPVGYHAAVT